MWPIGFNVANVVNVANVINEANVANELNVANAGTLIGHIGHITLQLAIFNHYSAPSFSSPLAALRSSKPSRMAATR